MSSQRDKSPVRRSEYDRTKREVKKLEERLREMEKTSGSNCEVGHADVNRFCRAQGRPARVVLPGRSSKAKLLGGLRSV